MLWYIATVSLLLFGQRHAGASNWSVSWPSSTSITLSGTSRFCSFVSIESIGNAGGKVDVRCGDYDISDVECTLDGVGENCECNENEDVYLGYWGWIDSGNKYINGTLSSKQCPTQDPTHVPTPYPTPRPTSHPTPDPTPDPTYYPSTDPTIVPTLDPIKLPTVRYPTHYSTQYPNINWIVSLGNPQQSLNGTDGFCRVVTITSIGTAGGKLDVRCGEYAVHIVTCTLHNIGEYCNCMDGEEIHFGYYDWHDIGAKYILGTVATEYCPTQSPTSSPTKLPTPSPTSSGPGKQTNLNLRINAAVSVIIILHWI